jgi:hypothetical protein
MRLKYEMRSRHYIEGITYHDTFGQVSGWWDVKAIGLRTVTCRFIP